MAELPFRGRVELIYLVDRLHTADMSLDTGAPKEEEFADTHEDEGNDEVWMRIFWTHFHFGLLFIL